jgi:hypothetical protein
METAPADVRPAGRPNRGSAQRFGGVLSNVVSPLLPIMIIASWADAASGIDAVPNFGSFRTQPDAMSPAIVNTAKAENLGIFRNTPTPPAKSGRSLMGVQSMPMMSRGD